MPIWTGTIDTDWNTAGNWSIDGLGNTGVPTAATDAIFDSGSSNPCTTGTVIRNCRDLITTGYIGTLEIGSSTAGVLRVARNITLGSQVGHITGLADLIIYAASGPVTLDVQSGVVIPNLNVAPNANITLGVVLTRTTVVTSFVKQGTAGSIVNFTSGGGSVELQISDMRATTTGDFRFAVNTALRFMGSATYNSFVFGGGSMILDTGATLTPVATNNLGVTITLGGTLTADFSAGTLVYPALSVTNRAGTYLSLAAGAMTFNFGSNTVDNIAVTALPNALSVVLQSDLVVNRTFSLGFGVIFTGGFNVIVKETLSRNTGTIRNNAGGKIIYKGTSTGFIGMGFISGTTLTITSVIQGSLSTNSVIHAPSVSTAANFISGVTTFETTYTVTFSQTIGSLGSPVMFYGYGIGNLTIGEVGASNVVLEIDAGSNDVYYVGNVIINGTSSELRYLSTNIGIFDGSKGTITTTNLSGVIDFQGLSSTTKFIGTLVNNAFFSRGTLKSDLYVNNLSLTLASGISQIGTNTIYVSGNFTANTGTTVGTVVQPTIELIGTANCNLECVVQRALAANIRINKDPLAVVTVTQNFTYGALSGSPYTFEHLSGIVNFGSTTVTVASNAIFNTNPVVFNNMIINTGLTITLNSLLNISGSLTCNGTTTFQGTHGFTTSTFTAQTAASILTFQNIDANPLAEYRITGNLTIIGTALSRITLQSAGSATFVGTANGTSLTRASGAIPSIGMVVSQTTGTAPTGFLTLFPNRPVINGGTDPNFTLDLTVTPTTGSISMRAGFKAKFILENNGVATQNVAYTTCQDIDSGLGQPILSFGSNNDDQTTNVSLFRTINWGSLDPPPVQGRNYASVYVY
jgi:hypothetical protein